MSYRAFITVSDNQSNKSLFSHNMGDDFSGTETLIQECVLNSDKSDFVDSVSRLLFDYKTVIDRTGETGDSNANYINVWCDQTWTIEVTYISNAEDAGERLWTDAVIIVNGYDASGDHVFMRKMRVSCD